MDEEFNNNEQGEDFEIFAQDHNTNPDDDYFDLVVSALQSIMLDEEFDGIQDKFMRKYCSIFEDSKQNKNSYMQIFILYQQEIEHFVTESLKKRVQDFSMPRFIALLETRTEQIDEQILDMIESFTEFQVFKGLMLEYKEYLLKESTMKGLTIKSNRIK